MLRSAKELEGSAIGATDGGIGHVKDFYFDDDQWVIRYLVVDTGGWLSSRKVLVSPIVVGTPNWEQRLLPVSISRDQVRKSPDIDTDKPVSRQHEMLYSGYYDFPYYWGAGGYWGYGMYPNLMMSGPSRNDGSYSGSIPAQRDIAREELARHEHDDPHLRSYNVVVGYHVHAADGKIGHVAGMLVDEKTWAIRYLIVDTSNWWLGHEVLIAPPWIQSVNWSATSLAVSMTCEAIKSAPVYNPGVAMSREDEHRLHVHYGHAGYWTGEDETSCV